MSANGEWTFLVFSELVLFFFVLGFIVSRPLLFYYQAHNPYAQTRVKKKRCLYAISKTRCKDIVVSFVFAPVCDYEFSERLKQKCFTPKVPTTFVPPPPSPVAPPCFNRGLRIVTSPEFADRSTATIPGWINNIFLL